MRTRSLFLVVIALAWTGSISAAEENWENPQFDSVGEAVAAAISELPGLDSSGDPALRFFVDLTLAAGDVDGRHSSSEITRAVVENILVTHPTAFLGNDPQRRTIERFLEEMPRQQRVLEERLARFSYPETPGLAYCRLVESVDAFAGLNRASSDKMSQVGGVTYYCRYVVLPLSYVGEQNVRELRRSAALNPSIDFDDTVRRWQRESFANLVNTFRHELVHVRTNSTLDVPSYSNRAAYPTWFHEGTATYLAADPHSGLSKGYQEFQELFFYLAQRHGIRKLQSFYADIFNGNDVRSALSDVYSISGTDELFAQSARWHRAKEVVKTLVWIAVLLIVLAAFRGGDRSYIGVLQVLIGLALAFALATGFAEHVFGLKGSGVVMAAKAGIGIAAIAIGSLGLRRILRHRKNLVASA